MSKDEEILRDILNFFKQNKVLEKKNQGKVSYASYTLDWLREISDGKVLKEEAMSARTTKKLQDFVKNKYPFVHCEAPVAEGMTLRFKPGNNIRGEETFEFDSRKMQCFDILDVETGTAFEISLSDAFAEFFKDVLKALLDSRVKKLYLLMRNHKYKGSKKSGFVKVNDSPMVNQYIALAKLYKLDVKLVNNHGLKPVASMQA